MPKAYYNEIDPFCAEWLRNLIFHGLIADGDVDERSIEDVLPSDLRGYTQCHFFAGIGVWSLALRNAGWRDDEPVWTGSCPCQPFSAAGKRGGTADERHLWPAWFHLIEQCRPRVVFGEQVASKAGLGWLDLVQADLEGAGYASGAVDICAAGVGAPHIRQRLYFVADSRQEQRGRWSSEQQPPRTNTTERVEKAIHDKRGSATGELGHADNAGPQGRGVSGAVGGGNGAGELSARPTSSLDGSLADTDGRDSGAEREQRGREYRLVAPDGRARTFWSDCDWLPCIDGKARPVEPGTLPLAHGIAGRVGRLRAYGNALVAPCAEEFIRAYLER